MRNRRWPIHDHADLRQFLVIQHDWAVWEADEGHCGVNNNGAVLRLDCLSGHVLKRFTKADDIIATFPGNCRSLEDLGVSDPIRLMPGRRAWKGLSNSYFSDDSTTYDV